MPLFFAFLLGECETWSPTLREEHGLRVFENRLLRIFGPKRQGITGGWRKLHTNDLHNLYPLSNTVWVIKARHIRWVGHVICMGKMRNAYYLGIDEVIILKCILNMQNEDDNSVGTGWSPLVGSCVHGN
jgi:hypothetical protein